MSKRVDIMVDIETLGKGSNATIFQISAIAFDIITGEHYSTFNKIADISKNDKLVVDGSTLIWWLNTNKELLAELLNNGHNSSDKLLIMFNDWIHTQSDDINDIHLWGNGILFDNKMIEEQLISLGVDYPIYYKNDRDVRTIVDLAGKKLEITEQELKEYFKDESLTEHDALDDVKYQIKLVAGCYNALIG
ncbi:3'-5' exonuclease [Lederbergia lenta]|uniref:3'-5' exonuclease n=1 Tax=Lederbergia lenta TaxID=1467 RepID=UPI00203DE94E|nr:3'-5' exonuclease [Lederbergia lenta]MCM3109899.1 3'-5' exoribonuclease [Lederbergia lenta]